MENQNQKLQNNIQVSYDDHELNYFSKKFGITREELLAVVKHGGTIASAVENYVKRLKFAV